MSLIPKKIPTVVKKDVTSFLNCRMKIDECEMIYMELLFLNQGFK